MSFPLEFSKTNKNKTIAKLIHVMTKTRKNVFFVPCTERCMTKAGRQLSKIYAKLLHLESTSLR